MTICNGKTLKGQACTKKTNDSSGFCHHHIKKKELGKKIFENPKQKSILKQKLILSPVSKNSKECQICLDDCDTLITLHSDTRHTMCEPCIIKLRDLTCPFCRECIFESLSVRQLFLILTNVKREDNKKFMEYANDIISILNTISAK